MSKKYFKEEKESTATRSTRREVAARVITVRALGLERSPNLDSNKVVSTSISDQKETIFAVQRQSFTTPT